MKILCIGNSTYDVTYPVDDFIKENTKNRLKEKIECGGGSASNVACLFGSWGAEVYLAAIIGNDYYGKKIKKELEKYNVNTKYLNITNEFNTPVTTIIVNKQNGSRTVLSYKQPNMRLKDLKLDFEPDIIFIDSKEYEISKQILKKHPNAISIIDAEKVDKETIELSNMVNYLICPLDFAQKLTNIKIDFKNTKTISDIYNKLKTMFKAKILVTLGENGVLYETDEKIKIMKSITVDVVDTTGAGDIFHGAFIYAIANKLNLEASIKLANITAGLSVKKYSARLSISTKEEVKEKFNEYR